MAVLFSGYITYCFKSVHELAKRKPPEKASSPWHGCAIRLQLLGCFLSWTPIALRSDLQHSINEAYKRTNTGNCQKRQVTCLITNTHNKATARKGKLPVTWPCYFQGTLPIASKVSTTWQEGNSQKRQAPHDMAVLFDFNYSDASWAGHQSPFARTCSIQLKRPTNAQTQGTARKGKLRV